MQASWSALAPVGGISILESFKLQLFPLRVQLERAIGRALHDYVFQNRTAKTTEVSSHRRLKKKDKSVDSENLENGLLGKRKQHVGMHRTSSGLFSAHLGNGSPTLSRQSSSLDVTVVNRPQLSRLSSAQDASSIALQKQEELNAEEMRVRATKNRTFISIDIEPTTLLLSYKV